MKIEYLDPNKLTPYKKNAKTHPETQIKKIINSINTYGFRNPIRYILHNKKKLIIAGHGRQTAAIKMGLKEVPAIKLDMSYEQALPYMIADNKTAESPWDEALLHEIFLELESMDVDLDATGFEVEDREMIHNIDNNPREKFVNENLETEHKCPKCGYEY